MSDGPDASSDSSSDSDDDRDRAPPNTGPSQPHGPLPLTNPPRDHKLFTTLYDSFDELMADLNNWADKAKFGVRKLRGCNPVKDFGWSRYDIGCWRGTVRRDQGHGNRSTVTKMRDCPWQGAAKALACNGRKWTFELKIGSEVHENHGPAKSSKRIVQWLPEHIGVVAPYINTPAHRNREIARELRSRFPAFKFKKRHLRNLRYRLKKKALNGYTPFQATKKMLDDDGIHHSVLWDPDDNTKPLDLYWGGSDWSDRMWKAHPQVQMYDNTYKTNNKGLAFFQIVNPTGHGLVFSCAFSMINSENQDAFEWIMSKVNGHRESIGADKPSVTITDYDVGMRNAVHLTYPDAKHQICIFHVNKNVALKVKQRWDADAARRRCEQERARSGRNAELGATTAGANPDLVAEADEEDDPFADDPFDDLELEEVVNRAHRLAIAEEDQDVGPLPEKVEYSRAGLYTLWNHIVYAHNEEEFEAAYAMMKEVFPEQQRILDYIEETWMPVSDQWATCHINKILNFGQRTTSPVEAVNRYLKSFLMKGKNSVKETVDQSFAMLSAMEESYGDAEEEAEDNLRREFLGKPWVGNAPYTITLKGMKLARIQYQKMRGAIRTTHNPHPKPLPVCTGRYTMQFGIPCSHDLLRRHYDESLKLDRNDFHSF